MYDFPKNKYGDPYDKNPYLKNEQPTILKKIPKSNIKVGYEWGNKDPWVVFVNYNGKEKWPRDEEYFKYIISISNKYSKYKFMHDFLTIYNKTSKNIDKSVLNNLIDTLSNHYDNSDSKNINYLFTVLYLAMVAEFHYVSKKGKPSIVNNKVKLIGIWQILFDRLSASEASKWSYYKSPQNDIIPKFYEAVQNLKEHKFKID